MQTFLPLPDYTQSAKVLDTKRLGKQRVECKQLLNTILGLTATKGWKYHPATRMWKHHPQALVEYSICICKEWIGRGYRDSLLPFFQGLRSTGPTDVPCWFGNRFFHESHQSNLLRKLSSYYITFNWNVPNNLPYFWLTCRCGEINEASS